jgi:hypothetical protein
MEKQLPQIVSLQIQPALAVLVTHAAVVHHFSSMPAQKARGLQDYRSTHLFAGARLHHLV